MLGFGRLAHRTWPRSPTRPRAFPLRYADMSRSGNRGILQILALPRACVRSSKGRKGSIAGAHFEVALRSGRAGPTGTSARDGPTRAYRPCGDRPAPMPDHAKDLAVASLLDATARSSVSTGLAPIAALEGFEIECLFLDPSARQGPLCVPHSRGLGHFDSNLARDLIGCEP